jgi:hypothetical protein
MSDEELLRKIRELVEPSLITLIALQFQEKSDELSFADAVKFAEEKVAEARKLLGFLPADDI